MTITRLLRNARRRKGGIPLDEIQGGPRITPPKSLPRTEPARVDAPSSGLEPCRCPLCHYYLVTRLVSSTGRPEVACPCQFPDEHWCLGPDFRMPPETPGGRAEKQRSENIINRRRGRQALG